MYVRRWTQPAGVELSLWSSCSSVKETRNRKRSRKDDVEEDGDKNDVPPKEEDWMWVDGDDELGKRQGRRRQERKRRKYSHNNNNNDKEWAEKEEEEEQSSPRAVSLSSLPDEEKYRPPDDDDDTDVGILPCGLDTSQARVDTCAQGIPLPVTRTPRAPPPNSLPVVTTATPALVALTPTTVASPVESDEDTFMGGGSVTKRWSAYEDVRTEPSRGVIWATATATTPTATMTSVEHGVEEKVEEEGATATTRSRSRRFLLFRWMAQWGVLVSTFVLVCVGAALLARDDAQSMHVKELQFRLDTSEEDREQMWRSQVDLQTTWENRLAKARTELSEAQLAHDDLAWSLEQLQQREHRTELELVRVQTVLQERVERHQQASLERMSLWRVAREEIRELHGNQTRLQHEVHALQQVVAESQRAHDETREQWRHVSRQLQDLQEEEERLEVQLSECHVQTRLWQAEASAKSRQVEETLEELQRASQAHAEEQGVQRRASQREVALLEHQIATLRQQWKDQVEASVRAVNAVSEAAAVEKLALVQRLTSRCQRQLESYERSALAAVQAVAQVPFL